MATLHRQVKAGGHAPVSEPGATNYRGRLGGGALDRTWSGPSRSTCAGGHSGSASCTGTSCEGARQISVEAPLERIPVFVRAGANIPVAG